MIDGLAKSQKASFSVIPVKTGIQFFQNILDSRLRGSDDLEDSLRVPLYWRLV
jgi:capsular polysaccharide biosynthesis protein